MSETRFASKVAAGQTIVIRMPDRAVIATLDDTVDGRAFAALLPLNLTLEDYAATEKISVLRSKLPARNAADGHTPSAGDIAYYAPWGNLAIFHKPFRHSPGLVKLGRLARKEDVELLARPGSIRVEIVKVAPEASVLYDVIEPIRSDKKATISKG